MQPTSGQLESSCLGRIEEGDDAYVTYKWLAWGELPRCGRRWAGMVQNQTR